MKATTMGRSLMVSGLGVLSMAAMAVAIPAWQGMPPTEPIFVAQSVPTLRWPTYGNLSQGFHDYHEGIDIAGPAGTAIVAAQGGQVIQSGWDDWGLGNAITLEHPDGSRTVYGHNETLYVQSGTWVERGDIIAEMGSTGNSTGPHLHFEYYSPQNQAVDPLRYLPALVAGEIPVFQPQVAETSSDAADCSGTTVFAQETRNYRIQICEVSRQLYYFGQSKAIPTDAIWLPAEPSPEGYQAINGDYIYQVAGDRLQVWHQNRVIRSEQFL